MATEILSNQIKLYVRSIDRCARTNMKLSTSRKGQVCNERHKVTLRQIAMTQREIANDLKKIILINEGS